MHFLEIKRIYFKKDTHWMSVLRHRTQVRCTNVDKYLFFEELALLWSQSVRLCNQRDDVDFVMKPFHEFDVQWFQTEK